MRRILAILLLATILLACEVDQPTRKWVRVTGGVENIGNGIWESRLYDGLPFYFVVRNGEVAAGPFRKMTHAEQGMVEVW